MMPQYEYKVVPAPTKGQKAKGVKTPEGRFAQSVQMVLNTMGADGWEYLRAELLPSDERSGLTGSATHWRNVLVFRRPVAGDAAAFQPRLLDDPQPHEAEPETPDSDAGASETDVTDAPDSAADETTDAPETEADASARTETNHVIKPNAI